MNTNFLNSVTNFLKKRTFELLGVILILASVVLAISFATYAPEDPSLIYGNSNIEIKNFPVDGSKVISSWFVDNKLKVLTSLFKKILITFPIKEANKISTKV